MPVTPLKFSEADLDLFCRASHDRNPLHISDEYARKTPGGSRYVFGILSGLAALEFSGDRVNQLSGLKLRFHSAVYPELAYSVVLTDEAPTQARVRISDGKRLVLGLKADFNHGPAEARWLPVNQMAPPEATPSEWSCEALVPGLTVEGTYSCPVEPLQQLLDRFQLQSKGLSALHACVLLGCSYIIGMKLPGKLALFTELSLDYALDCNEQVGALHYKATVVAFDARYSLLTVGIEFRIGDKVVAHGELVSNVRREPVVLNRLLVDQCLSTQASQTGKVALVIGGSRGLGRAISYTLDKIGCTTYVNYLHSEDDAKLLKSSTGERLHLFQADSSTLAACRNLYREIEERYGRLDFLVLNAAAAPRFMAFTDGCTDQLVDYVSHALKIVATPMSVFLPLLDKSGGSCVVISSEVVAQPIANWTQYIGAKFALEGLVRGAHCEYTKTDFLVVRPPRLLTDWTSSSLPETAYLPCESVAVDIVSELVDASAKPGVRILDKFARPNLA